MAEPDEKAHARPAHRHKEVRHAREAPRNFRAGAGNRPTFFGLLR